MPHVAIQCTVLGKLPVIGVFIKVYTPWAKILTQGLVSRGDHAQESVSSADEVIKVSLSFFSLSLSRLPICRTTPGVSCTPLLCSRPWAICCASGTDARPQRVCLISGWPCWVWSWEPPATPCSLAMPPPSYSRWTLPGASTRRRWVLCSTHTHTHTHRNTCRWPSYVSPFVWSCQIKVGTYRLFERMKLLRPTIPMAEDSGYSLQSGLSLIWSVVSPSHGCNSVFFDS